MDENNDLTPSQEEAAFLAGFNGVSDGDPGIPHDPDALKAIAEEPEGDESKKHEPTPEVAPAPVFAGFTEAEIKSLFAKVGEFDSLKEQLAKAHGKIGELNRTLQESHKSQPTQGFSPLPAEEMDDLEKDYPEFVQIAEKRARKAAADAIAAKGDVPDVQAIIQQATAEVRRDMEIRLMDVMAPDWKQTVQSDEFRAWEAVQPDPIRQMFASTESAAELTAIIKGYQDWASKAKSQTQRNRNRLESAVMPDGVPSKSIPSLSDEDAFMAGFRSVRGS